MNTINSDHEHGKVAQFLNIEKPGDDPKGDNPIVVDPPKK